MQIKQDLSRTFAHAVGLVFNFCLAVATRSTIPLLLGATHDRFIQLLLRYSGRPATLATASEVLFLPAQHARIFRG